MTERSSGEAPEDLPNAGSALRRHDRLSERDHRTLVVELPDVVGADRRLADRREVERPGSPVVVDVLDPLARSDLHCA